MAPQSDVVEDFVTDANEVDAMVRDLDPERWSAPTPAVGWTVKHQVAHLAATFQIAAMAVREPSRFTAMMESLGADFSGNVEKALNAYLQAPTPTLLQRWRAERDSAAAALAAVPPDHIVPWLVRPIPAATLTAAGMMELFGHGQDIADALGIQPGTPTGSGTSPGSRRRSGTSATSPGA